MPESVHRRNGQTLMRLEMAYEMLVVGSVRAEQANDRAVWEFAMRQAWIGEGVAAGPDVRVELGSRPFGEQVAAC
jgi:hypothetical protein